MTLLQDLKDNIIVLTARHSDGSEVKYRTTKRTDVLESMGVEDSDSLYDIDTNKEIPEEVLETVTHYEIKSDISYESKLDELANKGAKITW